MIAAAMMLGFDNGEKKHPFSRRGAFISRRYRKTCSPVFEKFGDSYDLFSCAVVRRIISMRVDDVLDVGDGWRGGVTAG